MRKRLTFKCWNCNKTYTLLREITREQVLAVACPFCNEEAVVDLKLFRKEKKAVFLDTEEGQDLNNELQLLDDYLLTKPV